MYADGSNIERLTFNERVNGFPRLSPGGTSAYVRSFPACTTGHPADLPLDIHFVRGNDTAVLRIWQPGHDHRERLGTR